ncbi:MAG: SDR family NAD(P)-dependent oxidoreductase [Candidatus Dormibacteria bacterium]
MRLAGSRVLVTGASSGIGEATARALALRGASICIVARRQDRLRRLADEIRPIGVAVSERPLDLTGEGAAEEAVRGCVNDLGGLDILVNNAGRGAYLPLVEVTPTAARAMFELNVIVPLQLIRAVVPHMRGRGGGLIVNIGSNAARMGRPNVGLYAATKSAVETMSIAVREELANLGIRVILVSPGRTVSEFGEMALRGDSLEPPAKGGLSPTGSTPVSADYVAGRIVRAMELESAWTAAPLSHEARRAEPVPWDGIES